MKPQHLPVRPPRDGTRGRTAFTLHEALVAIAIVALLVAVALPVVNHGLALSRRADCLSNMRQIGTAIHLYANDHNGKLPPTTHSTGNLRIRLNGEWVYSIEASWIYVLADYLAKIDEVRVCPADEPERRRQILEINATSYLLNDLVFDSSKYDAVQYNRLINLPFPSKTLLMVISNRSVSKTWDHAHCGGWTSWAAMTTDAAVDRHRAGSRAGDFSKGSSNYLYADGHVENIPAIEMRRRIETGINPGAVPIR